MDIESGAIPTNDTSLFIKQRAVSDKKPPVLPVLAKNARFDFARFGAFEDHLPLVEHAVKVILVCLSHVKAVLVDVVRVHARIVEHRAVGENAASIRQ